MSNELTVSHDRAKHFDSVHKVADATLSAPKGAVRPLDHAHLARYTLGDRSLELEILDLFLGETPRTLRCLEELALAAAVDAKAWHAACHTLKGSARAVGAFELGALAEAAEKEGELAPPRLQEHVHSLFAAVTRVADYISVWRTAA